jgi:hypothetical protein
MARALFARRAIGRSLFGARQMQPDCYSLARATKLGGTLRAFICVIKAEGVHSLPKQYRSLETLREFFPH